MFDLPSLSFMDTGARIKVMRHVQASADRRGLHARGLQCDRQRLLGWGLCWVAAAAAALATCASRFAVAPALHAQQHARKFPPRLQLGPKVKVAQRRLQLAVKP